MSALPPPSAPSLVSSSTAAAAAAAAATELPINDDREGEGDDDLNRSRDEQRVTEAKPQPPSDNVIDRSRMDQAIRFWNHPSLQSVPSHDKVDYLCNTKGFTMDQIYQLWDQLVVEDEKEMTEEQQTPSFPRQGQYHHQQQYHPTAAVLEEETSPNVPTVLAIGSLLGLTAAAAVRWLNGGDFVLLPPATMAKKQQEQINLRLSNERNVNCEDEDEDEAGDGVEEDENERAPSTTTKDEIDPLQDIRQQLQELTTEVQSSKESHERFIQQLQSRNMTDQSMALLRRSERDGKDHLDKPTTTGDSSQLTTKLKHVRSLLGSLPTNPTLEEAISEVNQLLQQIDQVDSDKTNETTTAARETDRQRNQSSSSTTTTAAVTINTLISIFQHLVQSYFDSDSTTTERFQEAVSILYLYISHLSNNPHVKRYQKIYTSNDKYKTVVECFGKPVEELLIAVGFEERVGHFEWCGQENKEVMSLLKRTAEVLRILQRHQSQPSADEEKEHLMKSIVDIFQPMMVSPQATATATEETGGGSSASLTSPSDTTTSIPEPLGASYRTPEPSLLSPPLPKKHTDLPPNDGTRLFADDKDGPAG